MAFSFPKICGLVLCALALASCAKKMESDVYSADATPGKVLEGKIIHVRAVTIKEHDKLEDNKIGGLAGAGAGLAAGSQIGHGGGNVAADVGGAIIGAVAGALIEDQLGTSQGSEYLVKLDKKYIQSYHSISKKIVASNKSTVEQDMASTSNVGTRSDIVSVVQATDADLHVGEHVYIIYNDDRPRLVADSGQ